MQETVRYIKESERDRGVPVVPVDAMLGTFGIEVGAMSAASCQHHAGITLRLNAL